MKSCFQNIKVGDIIVLDGFPYPVVECIDAHSAIRIKYHEISVVWFIEDLVTKFTERLAPNMNYKIIKCSHK